jgi:hypothetical protein
LPAAEDAQRHGLPTAFTLAKWRLDIQHTQNCENGPLKEYAWPAPEKEDDMEASNAFIDQTAQPTSTQITAALGESTALWRQLIDWLVKEQGIDEQEWKSLAPKYGWSLRMKVKKRTVVYLGPCSDCFRASFVLGEKAVAAARRAALPKNVLTAIDEARHYAEGTGLQLIVHRTSDLPAIQRLVEIKLAN